MKAVQPQKLPGQGSRCCRDQSGKQLSDHRSEFEPMSGKTGRKNHIFVQWRAVDDEMVIRCHGVHAGGEMSVPRAGLREDLPHKSILKHGVV